MWQLAKRLTTACLCAGMPLEQLIPPAKVLFLPSFPQHCLHMHSWWLLQLVVVAFVLRCVRLVLCCPLLYLLASQVSFLTALRYNQGQRGK